MMTLPVFLLGVLVTGITIAAVLSVGVDDAAGSSDTDDAGFVGFAGPRPARPQDDSKRPDFE
jgi:hypothetical protein